MPPRPWIVSTCPPHSNLSIDQRVVDSGANQPRPDRGRSLVQHLGRLCVLLGSDHDHSRFDDPGLCLSDRRQVVTEPVHVIHADRHHDPDSRIDDVCGVPASTQSYLQHSDRHRQIGEGGERKQCDDLEVGQRSSAVSLDDREDRNDVFPSREQPSGVDEFPVQADALAQGLEVRAGEATGSDAVGESSESIIAAVDDFPFVPAMWIVG